MRKRHVICALFSLLLLILSTTVPVIAGDETEPLDHVRLQLKWKHQFQFAGYYAALEKGYYREAGLDVTLLESQPGQDPVETMLGGGAEFGVGTSDLILLRSKGKPIVVLATIYQHSPLVLLTRGNEGTQDLQSLYDKPMMIEPQSAELFAYFKNEGIDPKKLHIVRHSFDVNDLISGKVAAMSAYSTDEPYLLMKAGVKPYVFTPRAGGIDFYGDNLFTTEEMIREHPKRVRAFLEASLKGWDYAMNHPEEMVDLILRKYNTQGKSREHLLYEAEHTSLLIHPELIEIGHMNKGRWRNIADTYAEFGWLPKDFPLKGFLYDINPQPDYRWLYWVLGGVSILALAAVVWVIPLLRLNFSLRSEIKERKSFESRLRESEKQYRKLAEDAPFPVAITDMETQRLLFGNHRLADMVEIEPEEAIGSRPIDFYVDPKDREHLLKEIQNGNLVRNFEVRLKTLSGRIIWVLLSAALVEFSERQGMMVAFQDITQQRTLQDELHKAKDAAEGANAAKSNYLAVMSHELRSPISGIIGLANLMNEESIAPDLRENLELIATTGESLNKLISNILDHSKLEAGRKRFHECESFDACGCPLLACGAWIRKQYDLCKWEASPKDIHARRAGDGQNSFIKLLCRLFFMHIDSRHCLSVIMPVFNEESSVEKIVQIVLAQQMVGELICVNDGSQDESQSVLEKMAALDPRVKVIRHSKNQGKGAALHSGIRQATKPLVIIQDADLEYDPSEYPKILAPILEDRADVVFGSRFIGSEAHRVLYFWHSLGNRMLTLLCNMFTNLNLTDMETCYKAFRREIIQSMKIEEKRFGFEPEITAKIARSGARIYEVSVSYHGRTYAEGKKIGWRDGLRALYVIIKYGLRLG